MAILAQSSSPAVPPTSSQDVAIDQPHFAAACIRWLDHFGCGAAQRARLKTNVIERCGLNPEPRRVSNFSEDGYPLPGDGADAYLSGVAEEVARGATELVTLGYVRALARELGVLYSSDGLERVYTAPDGQPDVATATLLRRYQAPGRGNLAALLTLLDQYLVGLRTSNLLVSWSADLGELAYQVLPPPLVRWWECPRAPGDERLAYAVAYYEQFALDTHGRPTPEPQWTAYVRPALPGDPDDAPTRGPYAEVGRLVRYHRAASIWSDPWPLPLVGDSRLVADPAMPGGAADGPNPLVLAGGWDDGRCIWSPLVLHSSEPLTSGLRLPVAEEQAALGEELDFSVSAALHHTNLQKFGVPVYRGPGDPPTTIGPTTIVHVQDAAGDFYFRSPEGDPEGHMRVIHQIMGLATVLDALPPDTFSYQPPSIETGPAKKMRRASLIQLRASRTLHAERPEQRRFNLERLLHNAHAAEFGRQYVPWDTEMTVRWGELSQPTDWGDRLTEMNQEVSLGLTELADLVAERHGVDRAEADRRVAAMSVLPDQPPEDTEEMTRAFMQGLWKAAATRSSPSAIAQLAAMLGLQSPGVAGDIAHV